MELFCFLGWCISIQQDQLVGDDDDNDDDDDDDDEVPQVRPETVTSQIFRNPCMSKITPDTIVFKVKFLNV